MTGRDPFHSAEEQDGYPRRRFLGGALGMAAAAPLLAAAGAGRATEAPAARPAATPPERKIKLGLVGCGGRGWWLGELFQKHGGYRLHAIADYFPAVVNRCGDALKVDPQRRFSGLSAYQRVIESGVEAVALIVPPGFLPAHSAAAAEAGVHVYMAKPVAVDVPGCLRVEASGELATRKQRVFFVDYQIPTDPSNIEVQKRIRAGEIGPLAKIITLGVTGCHDDPPLTANIESRLRKLIWDNDIAIGGSYIVSFDIHAIDAALWVVGQRPIAAMGYSRICRPDPHGGSPDTSAVAYEYADGLIHSHTGGALPNGAAGALSCTVHGRLGHGLVQYEHTARVERRGNGNHGFTGHISNLYEAGAQRNIASFYQDVTRGNFQNPLVRRAVDGCLTCILGREAALRRGRLTMDELLKESRRVEMDVTGLNV